MSDSIQMVDLKGQYDKIKEEVHKEMNKVLESTAFINGPAVNEFADQLASYLKVKHVIPCANGTDALQIAMMAYNFKKGSEILVPSWTYVATVEVIALLGLIPVFVEVDPNTFNLDVTDLERKISNNSVAIVPVHLYGQCADMDSIMRIAAKNNLVVIEDTAQALGADHTNSNGEINKAGTIGHVGTTSFFPSKNLGCFGDGGAMMTNDDDLAKRLKMISNHGQSQKYINESIGVNSRLDTLQAAILKVKLKYLDDYAKARNEVAERYDQAFAGNKLITAPGRNVFSTHVFHQYTIKLDKSINRDEFKDALARKSIPSMIYYPIPNHLQKAYSYFGFKEGDLPITEELSRCVISLPIHTEMEVETQKFIVENVLDIAHETYT